MKSFGLLISFFSLSVMTRLFTLGESFQLRSVHSKSANIVTLRNFQHVIASKSDYDDDEIDVSNKGLFKIPEPENTFLNREEYRGRSPTADSDNIIILLSTMGFLFVVDLLFIYLNKDISPPPYQ
mmetsp:Transcript_22555/g.22746  ORF Transcript_22555/g.22746 Transcript_22555/m.22746 type:complete len:125 (+) Transcript_22555:132-506(+)